MDASSLKTRLVRCGWLAGVFSLLLAVFGSLWAALLGLGDAGGSAFFQGLFWGTLACWVANAIALVGFLTWHVLDENPSSAGDVPLK